MSTLRVTTLQSNSATYDTAVRLETSGGTENGRVKKMWVDFNGTGTVAIRADFNVNSVGDRGTGQYTVNYSNSLSSSTYACIVTAGVYGLGDGAFNGVDYNGAAGGTTTGSVAVRTWRYDGNAMDINRVYVSATST
jgi:hypothetical protein